MKVRDVAAGGRQFFLNAAARGIVPERDLEQVGLAHLVDGVVVHPEFVHIVAARPQHRRFDADDFVLAAWLLVVVVNKEDRGLRHAQTPSGRSASAI